MKETAICGALALLLTFTGSELVAQARPAFRAASGRRVVILAIDGLRPDHLNAYLTDPKYRKLRQKGFLAKMLRRGKARLSPEGLDRAVTAFPSYTFPTWGTVFTGHFPGKHGIFGQTFLLRDKRGWSGRQTGQYYDAGSTFTDGPHAYGYEFDGEGQKKIDRLIGKLRFGPLKKIARRAVGLIEKLLRKLTGEQTVTLAKLLDGFKNDHKSAVVEFLRVPTVYDFALEAGLSPHVVYNFYHPRTKDAGDGRYYTRPSKGTIAMIGLANKLGSKLVTDVVETAILSALGLSQGAGKLLDESSSSTKAKKKSRWRRWLSKATNWVKKTGSKWLRKAGRWVAKGAKRLIPRRVRRALWKQARRLLDPVRKALSPIAKMLRSIGRKVSGAFLPHKYVNRVRGHIYHDQQAARAALRALKRRGDIPHIFTIYQAGLDECSHKVPGYARDLRDIQARCLAFTDHNLKPVIDAMRKMKAFKDTMLVLVSDHGHTRGHRPTDPQFRIAETPGKAKCEKSDQRCRHDIRGMMKAAGVPSCQYVEARNGHMNHLYLMPDKRVIDRFRGASGDAAQGCQSEGKRALAFDDDRAARAAARLAGSPDSIPRGIAGIFARKNGAYHVYYARRTGPAEGPEQTSYPQGRTLEEFAASADGQASGFLDLVKRLSASNDPARSGDIVLVSDPVAGFSFSGSPGTHGGLLSEDSLATLVFFGPAADKAARGTVRLRRAYQTDIAPSILEFLGVSSQGMSGRPLFDRKLRPSE